MESTEFWRIKQVSGKVGAASSTIYEWVRKGLFPGPVQLGPRATGWYAHEVQSWLDSRPRTTPKKRPQKRATLSNPADQE